MTDCAFKWVKAREVVKRTLKEEAATSALLTLPTITFLTALHDNALRPEQKLFPQNLVVKQGILYYVPHATEGGRSEDSVEPLQARIVVPESLRLKLLYTAHDLPSSGHRGSWGTYQALRRRYWWPQMRKTVYHYCKGCMRCHKSKASLRNRYGYMREYAPCAPGHTIHIDHFGPFVTSTSGNTVVLTVIDRATGYLWAYPCRDAKVETLATTLYRDHFLEHGHPRVIVSDNGPSFRSGLMRELNKRAGCSHLFTTPYRPQSNGKVERVHRTMKAALKIFVNIEQTDWDDVLRSIIYAIRTTAPSNSVYTPFYLWHNRHPTTPLELLSGL